MTSTTTHTAFRPYFRMLASAVLIGLCAAWALRPLPSPRPQVTQVMAPAPPSPEPAPFDLAAYSAPIWYAPPPEPTVEATRPEPPPPPLDLQLIAIIDRDGRRGAVFYDPSLDLLIQVEPGQAIGHGRAVAAIQAAAVLIDDRGRPRTIALDGGRP